MPLTYWSDAFETAVFLINRMPTTVLKGVSPLHKIFGTKSDYEAMRIFVCACFPLLRPYNAHKLFFIYVECVFMGYILKHKGYKCLDTTTNRTYISRHVLFNKAHFPFSVINSTSSNPVAAPTSHGSIPARPFVVPASLMRSELVPPSHPQPHGQAPAPRVRPPSLFEPAPLHDQAPSCPQVSRILPNVPSSHATHSCDTRCSPLTGSHGQDSSCSPQCPGEFSRDTNGQTHMGPADFTVSAIPPNSRNCNASSYPDHVCSPRVHPFESSIRLVNSHSMVTRAKAGVFKPKVFLAQTEPTSVAAALADSNWKQEMVEEF